MDMKKFIEAGREKAGNNKELARILGQKESVISDVKAGKKGLPFPSCILLANLIEVDHIEVVAASNLITEKDERKRKIIESCFKRVASVASIALVTTMLTLPAAKPVNAENLTIQFQKIFIIGNINLAHYVVDE